MSVPADELLETGRDGRPECSRIWDDWDFYDEVHIAFRANFVPNPFITFRSFVKDMGYINSRIIDNWTVRNCELRRKESDGESVPVYSFRGERVARLSDAYVELTGNDVNESESEMEYEESYSANSQYVQYLIFFEKSNARKLKTEQTDYDFRMRGYNFKTISTNTSILYLTVIADPVDHDYNRSRLYEFLIDNLVAPLNRFSNRRN